LVGTWISGKLTRVRSMLALHCLVTWILEFCGLPSETVRRLNL